MPADILLSPSRRGATAFPWPGEVIGACTALRANRVLAGLLAIPTLLADVSMFPGVTAILRRWSPIGQLGYGRHIAVLGFQYTRVTKEHVDVDWVETPERVRFISEGWLLARIEINDRLVYVDRRCGRALIDLWSSPS
jgi:hypothetical protein